MTINGLPLPPLRIMLMIALPLVLTLVMITAIIVKTVSEKRETAGLRRRLSASR
ncbi:MAG: hypothetical protein IJT56_08435 [Clostridia bacterium]|nr:hypothetical protein [Clostridia bacterium]